MSLRSARYGFTLVELSLSIAFISVLSSFYTTIYTTFEH